MKMNFYVMQRVNRNDLSSETEPNDRDTDFRRVR
ncbi:MAG: hypothetical protein ACI9MB_002784 [Verrucomicrobiales bacterium]|jgi:hypothetical protein